MSKSDENDKVPARPDYSELPEEVEDAINSDEEIITKSAKISYDGRQHVIRIPSEISRALNISKGDEFEFKALLTDDGDELTGRYVQKDA